MKKIIFASNNKGKVEEVKHILGDLDIQIISLVDIDDTIDIEESGDSFEENALIKAEQVFERFKIPTMADDSGLVVQQLNGAPGIYSSRYARVDGNDKANNEKLLNELKNYPHPHRAKFVCAAVYFDSESTYTAVGEFAGKIIDEEVGNNGFGYDPLFVPDGYSVTLAQLEPEIKNRISHRLKAFENLKNKLL
ncbi:MAG: RdgB/HAM1 family non-canonical purine NTP pyrophosphatase [Ignavibacteria bacterium]|nr:RdgB/HAM1 family non-canonical purine NTP pyrophosphatase [Ignavibacteria bacterium]